MWRTGPLASQCRCPLPRNKKTRHICAFQSMKCHVCDWQLTSCHPHLPPHTHTHMRYMYMSILLDYSPWLLCMCECMCVKAHRLNHGWQTKPASQYTCCVGVLPQVYKGGRLCMCMCVCVCSCLYQALPYDEYGPKIQVSHFVTWQEITAGLKIGV